MLFAPPPLSPYLQFLITIGSNFSWAFYSSQTNKVYVWARQRKWQIIIVETAEKCKLKSRIKLNSNIQACAYIIMIQLKLLISNRCCCWWLPIALFEFSSYYSHSWSSYTCSSSCWHWLYLLFKGHPFKKSLSFIYEHFLLLIFSRSLHLRRKRIFLLCSLW